MGGQKGGSATKKEKKEFEHLKKAMHTSWSRQDIAMVKGWFTENDFERKGY